MSEKYAPLKKLYADNNNVDAQVLLKLLLPFIQIDQTSKDITFLDNAHGSSVRNKILLFLLAKKVLFLLGDAESDRVKPSTIVKETGIPRGSVLPSLKYLRERKGGNLVTSQGGEYFISGYQISKIKSNKILSSHEKTN